ncbi:Uncharacterised protein [Vibrio cholerae]|nr:Uncharacterised protein [Vibrio cholerae]
MQTVCTNRDAKFYAAVGCVSRNIQIFFSDPV